MRPIRTLTLLLLLAAVPATAQETRKVPAPARPTPPVAQPAATSLKQVRDAHAAADADRSGALSASEAVAAGVEAAAFVTADSDGDQKLSTDEFVVWSEARAARQAGGAAPDLAAESTRLQALRRAQKSEELKNQREAKQAPAAPGAARTGSGRQPAPATAGAPAPADGATAPSGAGPAAARRATPPESAADREQRLEEIRAGIARRLRNGEISAEEAREAYAAVDRRIGNALGETQKPAPGAATQPLGPEAEAAKKKADLAAIEESLNRRLRNGGLDPDKAKEIHGDVSKRIDNAQGGGAAPAGEVTAGSTPATGAETFRGRVLDAQGDLTRRMRNAELTPEQAAAEREALRLRTQRAADQRNKQGEAAAGSTGANPTPAPAVEPARPSRARGESETPPPPARRPGGDAAPTDAQPARTGGTPPAAPATRPVPARTGGNDKPAVAPTPPPPARPAPQPPPARPETKPARPPAGGGDSGG